LLTNIASDLAFLVQTEFRMARAELSENMSVASNAGIYLALGGVVVLGGFIVLLLDIASRIKAAGLSYPWSLLIVAIVALVIGAALCDGGRQSAERFRVGSKSDARADTGGLHSSKGAPAMTPYHEGSSTSRGYEREAEHTRRRLAEKFDELSERLTPGQVFDEMLTYSRAKGGTFLATLSNAVRQNPLPSLLLGAGCMMFLSEKIGVRPDIGNGRQAKAADERYGVASGRSAISDAADRISDAAGRMTTLARDSTASVSPSLANATDITQRRASDMAAGIAEPARQTAASAKDAAVAARGVAHDARDIASSGVERVRRSAQTAAETMGDGAASMSNAAVGVMSNATASVRDTAASVGGRVVETADRTRRHAADMVRQGRESAASFISEQRLLCAAIGVAVGAAFASMLPSTDVEDNLMGETSDAVKGAVKDVAQRTGATALDSAKNVASKVADRAQTAAADSALAEAACDLGDVAKKDAQGVFEQPTTEAGPREGTSALDRS
jgi:hypothetical protein